MIGVTCLLIACKYEEIYPPNIQDLVNATDRSCTKSEILRAEYDIITALDFNMTVNTPYRML